MDKYELVFKSALMEDFNNPDELMRLYLRDDFDEEKYLKFLDSPEAACVRLSVLTKAYVEYKGSLEDIWAFSISDGISGYDNLIEYFLNELGYDYKVDVIGGPSVALLLLKRFLLAKLKFVDSNLG